MKPPTNVKWSKAEKGEGLSIVYYDKEGNQLIRRKDPTTGSLKGSKAWRHNNPGNLVSGSHVKQHGAIGSASYLTTNEQGKEQKYTFAIFPSKEITLKGILYHAHTAHHRRRVLMTVKSWQVK